MNDGEGFTFHHHWWAYRKPVATSCLLAAIGSAAVLLRLPLGVVFLAMGVAGWAGIYLFWTWHTLTFTQDHRLIRRRGICGSAEDVITLFGVITPYQTPFLGRALDVGSVHLGIPGPNIHIKHIASFAAFYQQLLYGAQQQQRAAEPPVIQVFFQMPPMPYGAGNQQLPGP